MYKVYSFVTLYLLFFAIVNNSIIFFLLPGLRGLLLWTGQLGGLMGIWFGASIASVMESYELFADIAIILFSRADLSEASPR